MVKSKSKKVPDLNKIVKQAKLKSKAGLFNKKSSTLTKESKPRKLKKQKYQHFKVHKTIKPTQPPLPSAWSLLKTVFKNIKLRKKSLLGVLFIYLLLSLAFVKGFGSTIDLPSLKDNITSVYSGGTGQAASGLALFGILLGSSGASSSMQGAGVYQTFIVVTFILAIFWVYRQKNVAKIKAKLAYYNGVYPIIKFFLVLSVIGLQMIPFAFGGWLYSSVIQSGLAVTQPEQFASWMIILLLMLLSLYLLSSSLFGLVIVTLPEIQPLQALRSARELVLHRRLRILSKLIIMAIVLLLFYAAIMLPFIIFLPKIAEWVFFVVNALGWLFGVTYVYYLYVELLNE